jgi:uncharacterized phage protein (TIGR02218 family)
MLALSAPYLAHLSKPRLELASCWKITRRDGQVFGYTDHQTDIGPIDGLFYEAAVGYSATDIESSSDLAVDNLNVQGIINSASITEADLMAGKWDRARFELFEVIYTNLSAGIRPLREGHLGEVVMGQQQFDGELRGMAQAFSQTIGELTSPTCRAGLGDSRCGVALGPLTVTGAVTSVTNARTWEDSTRAEAAGYFTFGTITWTGGANAGLSMEVKSHTGGGVVIMHLPMPYLLAVGDTYSMAPGCDKLRDTCRDKYSNIIRFRGEPDLPGQDELLQGGAR